MSYKLLFAVFMILLMTPMASDAALPISENKRVTKKLAHKTKERKIARLLKRIPESKNPNRNANLAFAFGLGSLFFAPLAIPALILGIISLTKKEPNKGFAIVGVVAGGLIILALFLWIMFLLLVLA